MPRNSSAAPREGREVHSWTPTMPVCLFGRGRRAGPVARLETFPPLWGAAGSAFAASRFAGVPRRMHLRPLEELRATRSTANHRKGQRHESPSPTARTQAHAKRPRRRALRSLHRMRHLPRLGRGRAALPAGRRASAARRPARRAGAVVARGHRVAVPVATAGDGDAGDFALVLESAEPTERQPVNPSSFIAPHSGDQPVEFRSLGAIAAALVRCEHPSVCRVSAHGAEPEAAAGAVRIPWCAFCGASDQGRGVPWPPPALLSLLARPHLPSSRSSCTSFTDAAPSERGRQQVTLRRSRRGETYSPPSPPWRPPTSAPLLP